MASAPSFFFGLFIIGINLIVSVDSFKDTKFNQRPLIIPLHLSSANATVQRHADDRRRHLLQSRQLSYKSNAHMRLYDDLLSNGYYTTRLNIGSPPQQFALIVDTGSTVTYVPCATCQQCGKHQDPWFQPEMSNTYQPLKCNPDCDCDSDRNLCTYERRYAEMSSSSGVLGEDVISFGSESELVPQRVVFGCENSETGDLYTQRADGIMGMGRGRLSIVDQLVDKGAIGDSFSLCYGGMDVSGGAMVLGGITLPPDMVFSHSDPLRSPYYNIELKEIHVAGKSLMLSPKIFDGRHGTVLDSGTTYAYLPGQAFAAFKDAIVKETHVLKRIHGPDPNYDDICFSGAGRDVSELSKTFPQVEMVFGNGQKLSLSPENYLFRHMKVSGAYCLGIFQNADPTTLLGGAIAPVTSPNYYLFETGIVVRNTLVTYDRGNDKVGFWKTNCSELWRRLQFPSVPAPTPSISPSNDSSIGMPPGLGPDGLPPNVLPGAFRIGVITFDMSISLNNSHTEPNFSELSQVIARELEVDDTQVHLLNVSSKGNDYLVRWGVFPDESANYISNTTALNIILRLREHHMQFPERFGSYQLIKVNVEPQIKKTWWQRNLVAVVLGTVITLLLSLSIVGLWSVWRRRQEASKTYQPVGAAVPEQELQPLQS